MNKEVTILLVDDDSIEAEAMMRAIRRQRILNHVIRASNGVEALEMLRDTTRVPKPRFTLLDINMPKMNGIECLSAMRDDPELHQEVVFVLTTSDLDEDKVAAYNFNVAGYLLKDKVGEDFEELLALIGSYWRVVEFPH